MADTLRCLDLFCGLGGFSAAFEDSDRWEVTTVDINERFNPDIVADVFELRPSDLEEDFDVVLASPPCTSFSLAANGHHTHFQDDEPLTDAAKDAVGLVYHTLGLINAIAPEFWVVENPRGKLRRVIGEPAGTVTLCQYGYDWQKPTDLWGRHPPTLSYHHCRPGADCHAEGGSGFDTDGATTHERDPAERAKLPYALSEEIRDSVETAVDGEVAEQSTLDAIGSAD